MCLVTQACCTRLESSACAPVSLCLDLIFSMVRPSRQLESEEGNLLPRLQMTSLHNRADLWIAIAFARATSSLGDALPMLYMLRDSGDIAGSLGFWVDDERGTSR